MAAVTPELLAEARTHVIYFQSASVTSLQRRLRVGYQTACRLLDLLEADSVVGPAQGDLSREVLVAADPGSYL